MDEQRTTPADVSMPGTSIAERPANQHMARFSDPLLMRKSDGAYVWSHTHGLVHSGMEHLYRTTSDEALADYIQVYADHFIDAEGNIESFEVTDYNIDSINAGKILFFLYERTGDERYRIAMGKLREQLEWHPRAHSGGFWHKRKYPWQIWLDGLSMAQPFYARYEKTFGDGPDAFDDIVSQFVVIEQKTSNADTGLLYHGWDESGLQAWADNETGLSPGYWSRVMGWYAIAKAVRLGILDDSYLAVARKAYDGILERIVPVDGQGMIHVNDICRSAALAAAPAVTERMSTASPPTVSVMTRMA